jgi:hypothetical protein
MNYRQIMFVKYVILYMDSKNGGKYPGEME